MIDISNLTKASQLDNYMSKHAGDVLQFGKGQKITIDTQMNLEAETTLSGFESYQDMPIFFMPAGMTASPWESQKAIMTAKGDNVKVTGVRFDGNDSGQKLSRGAGYENFFNPDSCKNLIVDNVYVYDTLGDGVRGKNLTDPIISRVYVDKCGHDGLYIEESKNVLVEDCIFKIRTNCGTRFRAVQGGTFQRNQVINEIHTGISTGPGFQAENSKANSIARNYNILNNYFKNTDGPGIWAIGSKNASPNAATGLNIVGNTFEGCGQGGPHPNVTATGGVCVDGWKDADIERNLFVNCYCSGVTIGPYITMDPAGSGYSVKVVGNMFAGISKGKQVYGSSGTAIDNNTSKTTAVSMSENKFWNNFKNVYTGEKVTEVNPLLQQINGLYVFSEKSPLYSSGIGIKEGWNVYGSSDTVKSMFKLHSETDLNIELKDPIIKIFKKA